MNVDDDILLQVILSYNIYIYHDSTCVTFCEKLLGCQLTLPTLRQSSSLGLRLWPRQQPWSSSQPLPMQLCWWLADDWRFSDDACLVVRIFVWMPFQGFLTGQLDNGGYHHWQPVTTININNHQQPLRTISINNHSQPINIHWQPWRPQLSRSFRYAFLISASLASLATSAKKGWKNRPKAVAAEPPPEPRSNLLKPLAPDVNISTYLWKDQRKFQRITQSTTNIFGKNLCAGQASVQSLTFVMTLSQQDQTGSNETSRVKFASGQWMSSSWDSLLLQVKHAFSISLSHKLDVNPWAWAASSRKFHDVPCHLCTFLCIFASFSLGSVCFWPR